MLAKLLTIMFTMWPPRSLACVPDDFSHVEIAVTGSCPTDYSFLCRYGAVLEAGTWTVCCVDNTCHISTFGTACAGEHFCDA